MMMKWSSQQIFCNATSVYSIITNKYICKRQPAGCLLLLCATSLNNAFIPLVDNLNNIG